MSSTPPDPGPVSEFLTVAQAAERLNISEKFIRRAIADDWLPAHRFGSAVRVTVADVDALAAHARTEPVAGIGRRRPPRTKR